jgi:7-cyano-7-deazaguanine synthase
MKKAVILASGGVDSSTVLAIAKNQNYEIHVLSFNYSQRNILELEKIKSLISDYNVFEHKIINIDMKNIGGSALTDHKINIPQYSELSEAQGHVPLSYVPARNTIFLSYALGYAETIKAYDIFIGVHSTDYDNYPDCRPEYIKAFENLANLAISSAVDGNKITIHAPLINMTKDQIIELGLKLSVDYSKTISCYNPNINGESCGSCLSCLIRLEAFAKNNITDPIKYQIL